jgi:hypothetical protein
VAVELVVQQAIYFLSVLLVMNHHRNSNGTTILRRVVGVGMQVFPARFTEQNVRPVTLKTLNLARSVP